MIHHRLHSFTIFFLGPMEQFLYSAQIFRLGPRQEPGRAEPAWDPHIWAEEADRAAGLNFRIGLAIGDGCGWRISCENGWVLFSGFPECI